MLSGFMCFSCKASHSRPGKPLKTVSCIKPEWKHTKFLGLDEVGKIDAPIKTKKEWKNPTSINHVT